MAITLQNSLYGWRANCANSAEAAQPLYSAIGALAGYLNEREAQARREREEAEQAEYRRFLDSHPVAYVRFGTLPESGRSRNYRDGIEEPGVSCYEARLLADGTYYLLMTTSSLASFVREGFLGSRRAFVLRGEVAGVGSDGEPCLTVKSCRKIKKGAVIQYCAGQFEAK